MLGPTSSKINYHLRTLGAESFYGKSNVIGTKNRSQQNNQCWKHYNVTKITDRLFNTWALSKDEPIIFSQKNLCKSSKFNFFSECIFTISTFGIYPTNLFMYKIYVRGKDCHIFINRSDLAMWVAKCFFFFFFYCYFFSFSLHFLFLFLFLLLFFSFFHFSPLGGTFTWMSTTGVS